MNPCQDRLIDNYNRKLNYLRVSITDHCNLKCMYCMPKKQTWKLEHSDILRYEEILRIVEIGVKLGISKIRVTGGEPLVRKGVGHFLKQLSEINKIEDISLTTNGIFLKNYMDTILEARISRINISLDSLEREKFKMITGVDAFDCVWEAVMTALDKGFDPIKINVVALKGINEDELTDFAKLSFDYPFHIRFIEHMPFKNVKIAKGHGLLAPEIIKKISRLGTLEAIENHQKDGPAARYRFKGAKGEIGIISPISHHFCDRCNRLRLTADGQLRPCLLSNFQKDLKTCLRTGGSDEQIKKLFLEAVAGKGFEHQITANPGSDRMDTLMSAIGG